MREKIVAFLRTVFLIYNKLQTQNILKSQSKKYFLQSKTHFFSHTDATFWKFCYLVYKPTHYEKCQLNNLYSRERNLEAFPRFTPTIQLLYKA